MHYYRTGVATQQKPDKTLVTVADHEADRFIVEKLRALTPDIPVVSEEGDHPDIAAADYFWLVDPLDSTRSFVNGEGYFTVNIGLIHNDNGVRRPVLGVIYEPQGDVMYCGCASEATRSVKGGLPEKLSGRAPGARPVAIVSPYRTNAKVNAYLAHAGIAERKAVASSYKFCLLAAGEGDVYPCFGPTSEWDTAAGHAILLAAGGSVTTPEGEPFLYGKQDFLNGSFVACAHKK